MNFKWQFRICRHIFNTVKPVSVKWVLSQWLKNSIFWSILPILIAMRIIIVMAVRSAIEILREQLKFLTKLNRLATKSWLASRHALRPDRNLRRDSITTCITVSSITGIATASRIVFHHDYLWIATTYNKVLDALQSELRCKSRRLAKVVAM